MKAPGVTRWARIGMFVSALALVVASFHSDILRDGNQLIAGFLALLGLSAGAAALGSRRVAKNGDAWGRLKSTVALEYLAIAALFGLGWVIAIRYSFFSEGPSGRDLVSMNSILVFVLAAIVLCSLTIRTSLRVAKSIVVIRKSVWAAMGSMAAVLLCLNLQTRADVITVEGQGRVVVESNGFPLSAKRRVSIERVAPSTVSQTAERTIVIMPNERRIEWSKQRILTKWFWKTTEAPPAREVLFKDGTRVSFETFGFQFSIPNVIPIEADFLNEQAAFIGQGQSYRNWLAMMGNVIIAILLIAHAGWITARIGGITYGKGSVEFQA
jgi:hypothetical protein